MRSVRTPRWREPGRSEHAIWIRSRLDTGVARCLEPVWHLVVGPKYGVYHGIFMSFSWISLLKWVRTTGSRCISPMNRCFVALGDGAATGEGGAKPTSCA